MGIIGTCAGSWIKIGAVHPNRFWLAFIGQALVAFSNIFVISVPATLAATWFGAKESASACSIGVFGNQVKYVFKPSINRLVNQATDQPIN